MLVDVLKIKKNNPFQVEFTYQGA